MYIFYSRLHIYSIRGVILHTHQNFSIAAETFSVVVCGNNLKLEVGPAHVSKHDRRLEDACVGLNDKAVLIVWCRWEDQAVCIGTVIPSVLVSGLQYNTKYFIKEQPQTNP